MDVTTAPVSRELLFGGEVTGPDGTPVADAVLTACGSRVATDAQGSFEVLAIGAAADPRRIEVTVTAAGYQPLAAELVPGVGGQAIRTAQLTDGTLVVLHDFVLTPAATTPGAAR